MRFDLYLNSDIEIEAEFKDPKTMKPIILFYHGKLNSYDEDSAVINDFKLGEVTIHKDNIKKIKRMTPIEANMTAKKFDTIGDMLRKDMKELDKRFDTFRKKL